MTRTRSHTLVMCFTLSLALAALNGCAPDTFAPGHEGPAAGGPSSAVRPHGSASLHLALDSESGVLSNGQSRIEVSLLGVESLDAIHFGIETTGDLRPLGWQTEGHAVEAEQGAWPESGSYKIIAWPNSRRADSGAIVVGYLTVQGTTGQILLTGVDGARIDIVTEGHLTSAESGPSRAVTSL